jgi:endoglucanase
MALVANNNKMQKFKLKIFKARHLLYGPLFCIAFAKSTPTLGQQRALAFQRAASLNNGINISWLEQTWETDAINKVPVIAKDFKLIKQLGFKSVRLPVAFEYFHNKNIPTDRVFERVAQVWKHCERNGLKLVIDYHYGTLADSNYTAETARVIKTWTMVAKRFKAISVNDLFFEIYNEPPPMNPQLWKDAAYNIVTAIRKVDPKRTLLVGASNYNSIYELSRMVRLADENIIYTFHFYEPFFFTHQGASWVGDQVSTTGVPFPYNVEKFPLLNPKAKGTWGETNYYQYKKDGNEGSIKDKLQIVKNWAGKYYVPILCTEYGVYNQYADPDSRCRYIKAMHNALTQLKIPGMLWEYNGNFSIFNGKPSVSNLPSCMREAIDFKAVPNK